MGLFRKESKGEGPRVMGVFEYVDDLLRAVESVREDGLAVDTVYSPVRIEEIGEALGARPSPVRFFVLAGAVAGITVGLGLSIYTVLQWKFIVSGKPVVPLMAFVIEAFEFCILFGVLFNLLGVLVLTGLPRLRLPSHYDPRFSEDRFGLVVRCPEDKKEETANLLKTHGAESTHDATE